MMDNKYTPPPPCIKEFIRFNCKEIDELMQKIDHLKSVNRKLDSQVVSKYEKYKELLRRLREKQEDDDDDRETGMRDKYLLDFFIDDATMAGSIIKHNKEFPNAQEKKEMIDYIKNNWDECRFKDDNMQYVEEFGEENENLYWDVNKRDDLIVMWCEIVVATDDDF